MLNRILAPIGMEFIMTEYGFEQPRVRIKYELGSLDAIAYKRAVPTSWIINGYVRLIEVNDEVSK